MVTYKAAIKERGNDHILTPCYMVSDEGSKYIDKSVLVEFWGLDKPDVESYEIHEERVFTEDFYKEFLQKIYEAVDAQPEVEEDYDIWFEIGDLEVELSVHFQTYWKDDSFGHLFGTQHYDPYLALDRLDKISDVQILDGEIQVNGFNYEDFWTLVL